jgi:riboflavin biosynthesis pyrimidine reductase
VFVAPKILGDGLNALANLGIKSLKSSISLDGFNSRRIGDDLLFSGKISK